jgi:hypothetical protein
MESLGWLVAFSFLVVGFQLCLAMVLSDRD